MCYMYRLLTSFNDTELVELLLEYVTVLHERNVVKSL